MGESVTIIGIGNEFRSDDALGLKVVRELRLSDTENISIVESDGDGAELIEMWEGRHRVIIVDAVSSGQKPGMLFRFDASSRSLPRTFSNTSSHLFGLAAAVELARELARLPSVLIIHGIEAATFDHGTDLSVPVADSLPKLVHAIRREIHLLQHDA